MRKTNAQKMIPVIEKFFDELTQKVFRRSELSTILAAQRYSWKLPMAMGVGDFINFLGVESRLRGVELKFPSRPEVRYLWGDVPIYSLLMSIKPGGYLSHYSAMFFHDLTDQVPRTIHLNYEQPPPARRDTRLDQAAIDRAFAAKARESQNIAIYEDYRICLISSMGKGGAGIVEMEGNEGEAVRVTNLQRTLIDIAVRPNYSGGIHEVLEAYRRAQERLSLNRLAATLQQMNYLYPYHQVIGFYLDRAGGFDESTIRRYLGLPIQYDFYLVHDMKELEREYSEKWRLFYPKGF